MAATLLYEANEWLSRDSMVLMGIFTERKALVRAVYKSIRNHLDDNFIEDDYEDCDLREDYPGCMNDFAHQMYREWKENGQTQNYTVNIFTSEVELNKFEEV